MSGACISLGRTQIIVLSFFCSILEYFFEKIGSLLKSCLVQDKRRLGADKELIRNSLGAGMERKGMWYKGKGRSQFCY